MTFRLDRNIVGDRIIEAQEEIKEFLLRRAFLGATVLEMESFFGVSAAKIRKIVTEMGLPYIKSIKGWRYFATQELLEGPK